MVKKALALLLLVLILGLQLSAMWAGNWPPPCANCKTSALASDNYIVRGA